MLKTTLKEIKRHQTADNDLTCDNHPWDKLNPKRARRIAYSEGVRGINGLLLMDMDTGECFVMTARTWRIWLYN